MAPPNTLKVGDVCDYVTFNNKGEISISREVQVEGQIQVESNGYLLEQYKVRDLYSGEVFFNVIHSNLYLCDMPDEEDSFEQVEKDPEPPREKSKPSALLRLGIYFS